LLTSRTSIRSEDHAYAIAIDENYLYILSVAVGACIIDVLDRGNLNYVDGKNFHGSEFHDLTDITVDDEYLYATGETSEGPTLYRCLAYNIGDASYVDASYSGEFGDDVDHVVLSEAAVAVACIPPMYDTEFVNEAQGGSAVVRMAFAKPAPARKTRHPARHVAYLALQAIYRMVGAVVNIAKPRVMLTMVVSVSGHSYFAPHPVGALLLTAVARSLGSWQKASARISLSAEASRVDDST
jgi:hypothetical protein